MRKTHLGISFRWISGCEGAELKGYSVLDSEAIRRSRRLHVHPYVLFRVEEYLNPSPSSFPLNSVKTF